MPAHDTPAEHLVRLRSALNLSLVGSVLFVLGVGSGAGADVRNDVAWPALPATIALGCISRIHSPSHGPFPQAGITLLPRPLRGRAVRAAASRVVSALDGLWLILNLALVLIVVALLASLI